MALIEVAFAVAATTTTRSSLLPSSFSSLSSCLSSSTQLQRYVWSIGSITLLSKRSLSGSSERASIADIEDLSSGGGGGGGSGSKSSSSQKKSKLTDSLLHRFRRWKGLCVTDITATEWCEKQQEFFLLGGKQKKKTKAMKVGSARHAALEKEAAEASSSTNDTQFVPPAETLGPVMENQGQEVRLSDPSSDGVKKPLSDDDAAAVPTEKTPPNVQVEGEPSVSPMTLGNSVIDVEKAKLSNMVIKKLKIRADSAENAWALKIINFIHGANQLLLDGLTRELPIISFAEGVCIIGVIDEIRMQITDAQRVPVLVETKTRSRNLFPSEPQQRNGRLQLMCYKHLFDNLISNRFPSRRFLELFSLNPHQILSDEIRENTANSGFPSQTLDDLLRCYQNTCSVLPSAHDQLLVRYEYQKDHSLISEDQFSYDPSWVKNQLKCCLEFWRGEREASYAPEEERWKCKFCKYTKICPTNIKPKEDAQQTTES